MNETTATIKQLSVELHVSEQALRQWCKRNEIQKTTKGKITSYILTENDVEQIRKHYTTQRKQTHNESASKAQRKENNNVSLLSQIDTLKAQLSDRDKEIEQLRHKVSALTEFNTLHNRTIDRLEQDKKKLNERLDKSEETIANLTTALQAAQALHGIDKAPKPIEVKEEPAADQTEGEPRKTSLFSRLFRRK